MPIGVVDRLEPVEVDEKDADVLPRARRLLQNPRHLRHEFAPVEKFGQGVMGRQETQLVTRLPRLGDIGELGDEAGGLTRRVAQKPHRLLHKHLMPVGVQHPVVTGQRLRLATEQIRPQAAVENVVDRIQHVTETV